MVGRFGQRHEKVHLLPPGEKLVVADADVVPVQAAADTRHVALCCQAAQPHVGEPTQQNAPGALDSLTRFAGYAYTDIIHD